MNDSEYTLGELARLYADAQRRMESLAARLEGGQFVNKDTFSLNNDKTDLRFKAMQAEIDSLKDDRKWLARLVLTFVVLAILGAVFAISGGVPN